jgi:Bax protein
VILAVFTTSQSALHSAGRAGAAIWLMLYLGLSAGSATAQEVIVFDDLDHVIGWLEDNNWWGEEKHADHLIAPNAIITGISQRWQANANGLPVPIKKEIFYRFMLPLVMHANNMVLDRRVRMERMAGTLASGGKLQSADLEWLRLVVVMLRISKQNAVAMLNDSSTELEGLIAQALYRLDVIPAGLVLGQAAYESGYGTSRFAAEGNALFGQWSFGGEGMVPEQQRANLGDHRIASFEWPFDSIRAYYINLSSHPAYEDFRRLRADLKAAGKPLTSQAMAAGLIRYSERGQEYVDTLKGIIRVNKLDVADDAVFRDEPMSFMVPAESAEDAVKLRQEIEVLRDTGELATIIARMQLE